MPEYRRERGRVDNNPQDIVWRYIILPLCDFQNVVIAYFWEYHKIIDYEILVYFSLSMDLWKLNAFINFLWSDT